MGERKRSNNTMTIGSLKSSNILDNSYFHKKGGNSTEASVVHLNEFLEYTNKRLVHSKADGNCLFRSISNCLFNSQERHLLCRDLCVQWMRQNLSTSVDGVQFCDTIFLKNGQSTIDDYLNAMSKDGEWGDFSCIVALSRVLNVKFKIVVVQANDVVTSVLDVSPSEKSTIKETIWLAYDEASLHYNLIVNKLSS